MTEYLKINASVQTSYNIHFDVNSKLSFIYLYLFGCKYTIKMYTFFSATFLNFPEVVKIINGVFKKYEDNLNKNVKDYGNARKQGEKIREKLEKNTG